MIFQLFSFFQVRPGPKTIKKKKNSTQDKYQTQRGRAYKVTSFLSATDCEFSIETCSKNVYSPGLTHPLPSYIGFFFKLFAEPLRQFALFLHQVHARIHCIQGLGPVEPCLTPLKYSCQYRAIYK